MKIIQATIKGGGGATMPVLVDDEDYEALARYRWGCDRFGNSYYARRSTTKAAPFPDCRKRGDGRFYANYWMHREVLCLGPKTPHVDHIDGNGLNNTKDNLRICTPKQNAANRSVRAGKKSCQFKGVYRVKRAKVTSKSWTAAIHINGRNLSLGKYHTPEEAAQAYDNAAKKYYGAYARLNLPQD